MNLTKFQWFTVFFAVVFLLNGCVVAPYDERENYLAKQSLATTSETVNYNTAVNAGYHVVRQGETLYGISKRYGFSYHDVAAWNNIYPPYTIWPGQQLLIYTPPVPVVSTLNVNNQYPVVNQYPAVVPASYRTEIIPLSYSTSAVPVVVSTVNVDKQYPTIVPSNYRNEISPLSYKTSRVVVPLSYTSRRVTPLSYSDSSIIPLNYKTSTVPAYYNTSSVIVPVDYIDDSNYVDDSYTYEKEKSTLRVVPVTTVPVTTAIPASNFHTVRSGETLASIADLYGLTTYELALWNDITSPYTVYSGQHLLIVEP